jgi:ABC-2 type transport system ATP-binding protein
MCDRALVIDRGRLVAEGSIDELRALRDHSGITLLVRDPEAKAAQVLEAIEGVTGVSHAPASAAGLELARLAVSFGGDPGALTERVVGELVANGIAVRELSPARASLEDVFAQLTRAQSPGEPANGAHRDPTAAGQNPDEAS